MSEGRKRALSSLSKASSLEEMGEFWDSHSLDEYWDQTHEVEFSVRAERRRRVTLDPEVYAELQAEAARRGITTETLVNVWLAERLHDAPSVRRGAGSAVE
jgi:hypothetical protein